MSDSSCPNCGVAVGQDDMFCENCGYDFITGSLPADAAFSAGSNLGSAPVAPAPSFNPQSGGSVPPVGDPPDAAVGSGSNGESVAAPSVLDPEPEAGGSSTTGDSDEASGSLSTDPGEDLDPDSGSSTPAAGDVPRLTVLVTVDQEYFDAVVNDGEIDFPDPVPVDQQLELAGSELHIGRTSESRAIHPDIDVAALTEDQAVSSRHALLRVANDGTYTVVDVGSTNGTYVGSTDSEAIPHGIPIAVEPGQPLYVGAWTRLTILP